MHLRPVSRWASRLVPLAAATLLAGVALPGASAATFPQRTTIDVLGTTDLHGNILNWDYFTNAPYSDKAGNAVGLAQVSTVVNEIRAAKAPGSTMLVDNGDVLQGTPLDYYAAKVNPITKPGVVHPMATAFNLMGYDSMVVGNHEFNYGIPFLREFQHELHFPLLGANVLYQGTRIPAFRPFTIKVLRPKGQPPVRVGILGITTPGSALWDKDNVQGKLQFADSVATAKKWVPIVRAFSDVVVVTTHMGSDGSSSYGSELPVENAANLIAAQVPGIDAILTGHTHLDVPEKLITNTATGAQVLITQPLKWGSRVADMTFDLSRQRGRWAVTAKHSTTIKTAGVAPDPKIVNAVQKDHDATVAYVNTVVARSIATMSAAPSRYQDTAILDFIQQVQSDTVKQALAGGQYANLPVISIAAPFSRTAVIPQGDVTRRDIAGLYIYDNTLEAVVMTAKQIKEYLEFSAEYYKPVTGAGPVAADAITNALTTRAPNGTPDYNYDIVSGVHYTIDLAKPVGSRLSALTYPDAQKALAAVADDKQFVVAVNNYRRSGGGGFPYISTAPVVYNELKEIRQLLIDWAAAQGELDPTQFFDSNWALVANGTPLEVTG